MAFPSLGNNRVLIPSSTDWNPIHNNLGWEKVSLPPPGIRTNIELQPEHKRSRCLFPFKTSCSHRKSEPTLGKSLNLCSGCKLEYYCDADCQRKDWVKHKPKCRAAQKFKLDARCMDNRGFIFDGFQEVQMARK